MDTPKKIGSPAEGETCTQVTMTTASDQSIAAELSAQQRISEVQVPGLLFHIDHEGSCDPDYEWMEPIDGTANMGHEQVADFEVKLIRRQRMRSAFWVDMEGPSEETCKLAFDVFDRYGRLTREYYDHEIRKGSGAWGRELDHGDILLFEKLMVKPLRHHQGIGTKVVKAILDKARAKSRAFFAFARPGCLLQDLGCTDEQECREAAQKQIIISKHFWLSLGFRRVGRSEWLAFTDDSTHPSRHLDIVHEWDEPERPADEPLPESVLAVLSTLTDPSVSAEKCIHLIQEAFAVQAAAPERPYTINGNTILHVAAMGSKAAAISYILAKYPSLSGIRNAKGHTPLEALQSLLEKRRTRRRLKVGYTIVVSDDFKGHSRLTISCLAALASTEAFDLTALSKQKISAISSATGSAASGIPEINKIRYTLRLKYGCTCGECIGGFLSPRMRFALFCQADQEYHMEIEELDYLETPVWLMGKEHAFNHLATPVRRDLETSKLMMEGFTEMYQLLAGCLEEKWLPDEETVHRFYRENMRRWSPAMKTYLERGGNVPAVVTMLFHKATEFDEWAGYGTHMGHYEEEIKELPVCRNDHEFGFVKAMCGYKDIDRVR